MNSTSDRVQRVKDYVFLTQKLMWQRQGSFLLATLLGVIYFNPVITVATYLGVMFSEFLDMMMNARAKVWDGQDPVVADRLMRSIKINTVVSALAISIAFIAMALQEPSPGHFTPLVLLFGASLFAAMNNRQMVDVLLLRLPIYGVAFLFITFIDVVRYHPPLSSTIWLNLFTVFFVLYFIVNISFEFYRNYQSQLKQLKLIKEESERTRAAYEVKSQFISTVSHELRTPLTSIKASLDLANAGVLGEVPERMKNALSIAAKNGQRLAILVDDLLDLQKIEAGEMKFQLKRLNANDLVKEAVEATTGYADKLGIHVTTILPAQELMIEGDQFRLVQVMNNLLSNATKFSKPGGFVQVRVEKDGNFVRISVEDEGVGIPESAKSRIFQKFSQVDSSDIRKVGGTGLGLHISKQIIERHEGKIDYTSQQGVGSTFYFELPLAQDVVTELPPGKAQAVNRAG